MVYNLSFFSLQNAVCFIILTYLVPVLFTFYIQGALKLTLQRGVTGTARMLHALTHSSISRQVREQM
jgi:hypothetical protein